MLSYWKTIHIWSCGPGFQFASLASVSPAICITSSQSIALCFLTNDGVSIDRLRASLVFEPILPPELQILQVLESQMPVMALNVGRTIFLLALTCRFPEFVKRDREECCGRSNISLFKEGELSLIVQQELTLSLLTEAVAMSCWLASLFTNCFQTQLRHITCLFANKNLSSPSLVPTGALHFPIDRAQRPDLATQCRT